jgi:hypothetical protein
MKKVALLSCLTLLLQADSVLASNTTQYIAVRESLFVLITLGCVLAAALIFITLKGGTLSTPWVFFVVGFALAGVGGVMQLLELGKILLHQYDIRMALLFSRVGSVSLFLIGLVLYKARLQ